MTKLKRDELSSLTANRTCLCIGVVELLTLDTYLEIPLGLLRFKKLQRNRKEQQTPNTQTGQNTGIIMFVLLLIHLYYFLSNELNF